MSERTLKMNLILLTSLSPISKFLEWYDSLSSHIIIKECTNHLRIFFIIKWNSWNLEICCKSFYIDHLVGSSSVFGCFQRWAKLPGTESSLILFIPMRLSLRCGHILLKSVFSAVDMSSMIFPSLTSGASTAWLIYMLKANSLTSASYSMKPSTSSNSLYLSSLPQMVHTWSSSPTSAWATISSDSWRSS